MLGTLPGKKRIRIRHLTLPNHLTKKRHHRMGRTKTFFFGEQEKDTEEQRTKCEFDETSKITIELVEFLLCIFFC